MKAYRLTHSACILVRHSCVRPPRKSRVIKLWDIASSALPSYWSPWADKSFLVLGLLDDRVSGSGNVQVITKGHLCLALAYTVHRDVASGTGLAVRDSCLRRHDAGGDSGCWASDPGELQDSGPRPAHPPAPGQRDSGLFSGEAAVGPGRNPTCAGTRCHPLATAVPGRLPGRCTPGIRLFTRQHLD